MASDRLFETYDGQALSPDCVADITVDGEPVQLTGKRIRVVLRSRYRRAVLELEADCSGRFESFDMVGDGAYVPGTGEKIVAGAENAEQAASETTWVHLDWGTLG